ncbi:ABC-F family ATP-binding cassette domain-containing protein [Paenibacillus turpanensis]|uniref:ABC-F family ATP-binding cassette domain-containing protein n=1 Tax=Paenibacillus turpanensis TaxID=2689078 RepID=UPI0014085938|nr:ABC-F family ATP-binding cassette domain-containing protein [Paenibacillus turpanensis]
MIVLTAEGLSKSYGVKTLFKNISLHIEEGSRIGLIGVNGSGKSSLLQALAGVEPADQGSVLVPDRVRLEYVPQEPPILENATVLEQVFSGDSPEFTVVREYEMAQFELESDPAHPGKQQALLRASTRMDEVGGWQLEAEAKKILGKLGIHRFDEKMGVLSGGQRKRVALAAALIRPCDLLILDEPTNHLDPDAVEWLEQLLARSRNALLMITHDRYFLDRVTNRILELDGGSLYAYEGNYSVFLEKKAERMQLLQASERKRQNLFRSELAWIRRGAKARTTKQKARIDRFEKLQSEQIVQEQQELTVSLSGSRLGKKVIELENVGKEFGSRTLFTGFSRIIQRDDRIGIIGPNGSGKSTLLRIIAGLAEPDEGAVETGTTVRIGYFGQTNDAMNESLRVIEYVREGAETVKTAEGSLSAAQMLERFLFPPHMHGTRVDQLSGGEKRRLYLLRLLMSGPNVLLLDEPTNDLDIATLSVLEDYIEHFEGAVITVSHDRFFLDRTADTLLAFQGNGRIEAFLGTYSEYRELEQQLSNGERTESSSSGPKDKEKAASPSNEARPREKQLKFSYKEQKEYEEIDERIAAAEAALAQATADLDTCGSDYVKLQEVTARQQELQAQLDALIERWTYLNELAEEIERNRANR